MAFINNEVFDGGLDYAITNGTQIDICSADPTTSYADSQTYSLGTKTGLTVGATEDADSGTGRQVVVPAILAGAPGTVDGTDTATHWALSDGSSILVASGALTSGQAVTDTNDFTLDEILITIRDAT